MSQNQITEAACDQYSQYVCPIALQTDPNMLSLTSPFISSDWERLSPTPSRCSSCIYQKGNKHFLWLGHWPTRSCCPSAWLGNWLLKRLCSWFWLAREQRASSGGAAECLLRRDESRIDSTAITVFSSLWLFTSLKPHYPYFWTISDKQDVRCGRCRQTYTTNSSSKLFSS